MPCRDRDENSPAQGEEELAANLGISAQFIWNCAWHGARNRDVAKMQVICAWCRHEGKPGYLGEREPFDNPAPTHGVCFRHREQFLESLPSTSFPDAEMLIVVRPNDTALYEYLRRNLAGVKGVKVIPERRQADRRREQRAVARERRHQERRTRQGETFALGYTLFRFKRKPPPGRGIDRGDL